MGWKNEFLDGGFSAQDATVLALRSDLARILRQYMARQPSQTVAARKLAISQSLVSDIMGGRIDKISIERLVKLMVVAGIPATAQWSGFADAARAVTGTWVTENATAQSDEERTREPLPTQVLFEPDEEIRKWLLAASESTASQTAQ